MRLEALPQGILTSLTYLATGLKDPDARFRKRHVDLLSNPRVRHIFEGTPPPLTPNPTPLPLPLSPLTLHPSPSNPYPHTPNPKP